MVEGLEPRENPNVVPSPVIDELKGTSRPTIKRKTNVRGVLSESFKYRHNLNLYRVKKHQKHGHPILPKDVNQAQSNADFQPNVQHIVISDDDEKDMNKGEMDELNEETDVPLDQNEVEMSCTPKPNAVNHYMYSSNSTTNTSNATNNAVHNDILNVVNNSVTGITNSGGGTRLVKKEITKLGRLELLGNIENYVHVNFSNYRQFYDRVGPIRLTSPLSEGLKSNHVDISLWNDPGTQLISQNSSKRKVYNIYWLPKIFSNIALRAAIKLVEDCNIRDGRSIKREIECHLYMYQRFQAFSRSKNSSSLILQDDWPTVEILGYYLDKKDPGQSVLISRKLTGPDFFYIIRSENNSNFAKKITPIYEFNKLDWCITALNRIAQFASVGIRHNDIKPDNIVLDVYFDQGVKKVDVKVIDLGAASMENTKEFTGGTPWYESPEQKLLEYYTKKNRNNEMASKVTIDVSSDAWGAGLSIVEVLTGKRVVDYIKQPYGIGLLNFKGVPTGSNPFTDSNDENIGVNYLWWNVDEYWEVSPELWVREAKKVLGLTCTKCSPANGAESYGNTGELYENIQISQRTNFDMSTGREEFQEFYFCNICNSRFDGNVKENICKTVARYVFNSLVVIDPKRRKKVQEVSNQLRLFVTKAISYYL
ncbi:uncharacterized protein TA13305 [Theileria annulata]|uniref:Protein kinase domain-containing protein n=1 Tax=Theileria annulata TaxID=5874 RepID=Q4UEG5_THEAN|nr:uncharacterized protein TA13305 [Theileria annulata]CAI74524.1 hypothetical protein TA13305 [Theileria annulata]|eukprot:XP_952256.1 hypothetical protein TA13305 [Theileria annulata]